MLTKLKNFPQIFCSVLFSFSVLLLCLFLSGFTLHFYVRLCKAGFTLHFYLFSITPVLIFLSSLWLI